MRMMGYEGDGGGMMSLPVVVVVVDGERVESGRRVKADARLDPGLCPVRVPASGWARPGGRSCWNWKHLRDPLRWVRDGRRRGCVFCDIGCTLQGVSLDVRNHFGVTLAFLVERR